MTGLRKECETCDSWVDEAWCVRISCGMLCIEGPLPERPCGAANSPKPEGNRFLLWSHENLAAFAKDVLAQNNQLRERLTQIRELAK